MPLKVFDGNFFGVIRKRFPDDQGECRLLVDGETLDRWQILRRALEPLFFAPSD